MLKIQMLEQIMNNENSDEEPASQIDESANEAFQNGHIDFFVKKRSTKR